MTCGPGGIILRCSDVEKGAKRWTVDRRGDVVRRVNDEELYRRACAVARLANVGVFWPNSSCDCRSKPIRDIGAILSAGALRLGGRQGGFWSMTRSAGPRRDVAIMHPEASWSAVISEKRADQSRACDYFSKFIRVRLLFELFHPPSSGCSI